MKSLLKKIITIIFILNLTVLRPVLVLAQTAPTPPAPPTPPSAPSPPPSPPSPPAPPSPPPAPPTPPSAPSPPPSPPGQASSQQASPTPTPAANEATNFQTGADSTNESNITNKTNTNVANENSGQVTNDVDSQVVTGGNTASYNTGGGSIVTGDAVQSLTVITNLNQNSTLAYPNSLVENYAQNSLTGSGSQNASDVLNKLNTNIYNANNGNLSNKILLNSVSGQNTSSYNTGHGGVQSGNAQADLSLLSAVNTNVTGTGGMKTFNIYDTHQGDLVFSMADFKDGAQFNAGNPASSYQNASHAVAENSLTGPDSENSSNIDNEENMTMDSKNKGILKNDVTINAISGENNTVKNTGEGDISTGNSTAVASLVNFLNTNLVVQEWMIGVVNIFGRLVGDIVLPKDEDSNQPAGQTQQLAANSLTGPDSENTADVNDTSTYVFENYNEAEVINNIETTAVTGVNTASYNTGPGKVQDGNATVNTSQVTLANNNSTGGEETFWLVLVNKLGEWVGNIVGAESGETIAGNLVLTDSAPEFESGNQEKLEQAANIAAGPDSENTANLSNQENITVKNENEAKIENDIKIVAHSGKNSGSYNTLGGDVDAGDAQVGLSLVNFVNNNLVGKKLIVLVVDVLGEWIGDLIPPDQEKENKNSNGQGAGGQENSQEENGPLVSEDVVLENLVGNQSQNQEDESLAFANDSFAGTYGESPSLINYTNNPAESFSYGQQGFDYGPVGDLRQAGQRVRFTRGLFASTAFAKEASSASKMADKIEVTQDWLYFLFPSLIGIVAMRNKKIRTFLASFL